MLEIEKLSEADYFDMDAEFVEKYLKVKNNLRNSYHSEFSYSLQSQATKYKGKYTPVENQMLNVNDVVLIKDSFVKAPNYPLARVLAVTRNDLGEATSLELLKANRTVIRRDVSSVILLVRAAEDVVTDEHSEDVVTDEHSDPASTTLERRPEKRVAATRCRRKISDLYEQADV